MKKKIISVLLICSMLFTILPTGAAFASGTVVASGVCGSNNSVHWQLTDDGILTVGGKGAIENNVKPWNDYLPDVTKIVIEDGITSIGAHTFHYVMNGLSKNNLSTKTIEMADSVTSIGRFAFADCTVLESISFSKNLTTIAASAFQGATSLKGVVLPASVTNISNSVFTHCTSLENITVENENTKYASADGVLYSKDMTELVCYPAGKTSESWTIPDSVSVIKTEAFSYCPNLKELVFGANVKTLEKKSIYLCDNLNSIVLNDGLEYIVSNCIQNCKGFTELIMPASVNTIGVYGLSTGNSNLSAVYFEGDAPVLEQNTGDEAYYNFPDDVVLYYIEGKADWTSPTWNGYTTALWGGSGSSEPEEPGDSSGTIITGTNPVNGATNVGYDASHLPEFHMQFNKVPATMNGAGVQIDASKEPFAIYRASDDELIWKDSSSGAFSTNMVINTNNTIVTVTPTNAHTLLEKNTEYYITMGEGYIKFADGTTSPAIKKGDWSFKTKNPDVSIVSDITIRTGDTDTKNAVVEVEWKDSWFDNSSNYYMHDLATASMALSGAAYVEKDGKPASDKIQAALTAFGFDNIQSFNYGVERTETDNDLVSFTFAAKPVEDNGSTYTLVAVVVKGTSGDEEWYSNFNIGRGSRHEGFQICADDIMDMLQVYVDALELDNSNAKFLVTGHSRGAAVANLVAKEITDSSFAEARNVYGYTFATPAVTTESNASKYNNIFNIVNGEDFVTRVPLVKWNYKRYGIDLLLPSRSYYGAGYNTVYSNMSAEYSSLVNKEFEPYNGTQKVDKLICDVIAVAPNVTEFYENINAALVTPSDYFNSLAECIVTNDTGALVGDSLSDEYLPITTFFVFNHKLTPRVFGAHSTATYYSWMDSCSAEGLFGNTNTRTSYWFKRAIVACPVDVYVYDEAGNLVASVVDETVGANTLAVSVEEGVKTIDLPDDQEYDIKIVAREAGTVSYNIEEYQATADGDEEQRMVGFDDIAIASGDELSGNVDAIRHTDSDNYALTKNNSETIHADYDSDAKIETISMHRLYNPNSGEHFYTGSIEERDMLVNVGWQYEGVAWNAPTQTGAPVYRLFNPNSGDHHYTMSAEEREMLVSVGWIYEGICWNSASDDNVPQYRLYNPNADCGSHHYTGSTEERDFLVSLGWIYEGIGWFGMLN